MKKSLLALAALAAFAGAASAQSSVTLTGTFDAGLRYTGTATSREWGLAGQQSAFDRFIITGTEDLGGNMKARFHLEHRFRIQNGTSNSPSAGGTGAACNTNDAATNPDAPCVDPFWRRSFLALSGNFGEVRLGRQDMPAQEYGGNYEPFGTGTVGSVHSGGMNATVRANSAITYHSPNLSGLVLGFGIAEATGQTQGVNQQGEVGGGITGSATKTSRFGAQRPMGFNFLYNAGPLSLAGGWDRNTGDLKTTVLYASYDFGRFKLMGQFEKGDNDTSSNPATAVSEKLKNFVIGVTVPMGAFEGRLGAIRVNSDLAGRDGSKIGIGGKYSLSKRTSLYSDIGKSSGDRFSVAQKKAAFDIGVTHNF